MDEAEAEAAAHAKSREFFQGLLNKLLRVKLTDGRVLVGQFLCTDRDANVILGSCAEYVPSSSSVDDVTSVTKTVGGGGDVTKENEEEDLDACMKTSVEPRILGLAMVKGKHIVTMHYDDIAHTSSAPKNSPQNQRKTTAGAENASVQMENLYL